MVNNLTPQLIWSKYQKAIDYNNSINLYDVVKNNEDYYIGKQWERCNAPDLQKITMNFIGRVVTYFVSIITSDNIGANIELYKQTDQTKIVSSILSSEINRIMENTQFKDLLRDSTRDCAVDADSALYSFFNPDIKVKGFNYKGEINLELLKNTTIYFGNPTKLDVQKQPYIIISLRNTLEKVKKEAELNNLPSDEIKSDSDTNQYNSQFEPDDYVTELIYLTKADNTVWCAKSTYTAWVKKPWNTEYSLYPISYWSWTQNPNSYHGISPVTNVIPNQDAVNKLYSMQFHSIKNTSFPKIIYDINKFTSGKYTNDVGKAIGVNGNPNDAIFNVFNGTSIKNEVIDLADRIIQQSKELMGANSASLGDIKSPDNTSAIVMAQKGSTQPLTLQQKAYYKFVEDNLRIWLDIMTTDYGTREVKIQDTEGNEQFVMFDFNTLKDINFKLSIDIGSASWWSEIVQIQTIDNLFNKGIIEDKILYLESIPDGYIKNKQKIIAALKKQHEQLDNRMAQYEQMAQFIETLPKEQQEQLKALPPEQLEQTVMAIMQQSKQIV